MLTLENLLKRLNKSRLNIHGLKGNYNLYHTANIVSTAFPLQSSTLYICPVSKLEQLDLHNSSVGFILIPDINLSDANQVNGEYVFWDEEVSFDDLFHIVQSEFCRDNEKSANISRLHSALLHGAGIEGLAEVASKILNNPIIITNSSYKVLAITDAEKEVADSVWQFAKQNGYCSQESINMFKQEKVTVKTMANEGPIVIRNGFAKEIPRMIKKIMIGEKVVGYIGVFKINKEFEQNDIEIVNNLSILLSVEIKHKISEENLTDIIYESLIIDLLNNIVPSLRVLENRLKAAQWSLKKYLYVVEVPLSKSDDSIWFFDYIYTKLKNCTNLARTIRYHDSIVMVINCNSESDFNKTMSAIKTVIGKNKIQAGVSRVFHSLNELTTYYHQACKALELGRLIDHGHESIYYYEDYAIFNLFTKIEDNVLLKDLCHPAYNKLKEYDKLNGTDFCHTLYQFVMCGAMVSDSAEKLFIHRNTMAYRLSKIGKITGLDLTNGEDIFRLYLSIKINQWIGL